MSSNYTSIMNTIKKSPTAFLLDQINNDDTLTKKQKNQKILDILEAAADEIVVLSKAFQESQTFLNTITDLVTLPSESHPTNIKDHRIFTLMKLENHLSKPTYNKETHIVMNKEQYRVLVHNLHYVAEHPFNVKLNYSLENIPTLLTNAVTNFNKRKLESFNSDIKPENIISETDEKLLSDMILELKAKMGISSINKVSYSKIDLLNKLFMLQKQRMDSVNFNRLHALLCDLLNVKQVKGEAPVFEDFIQLSTMLEDFIQNFKGMKKLFSN